MSTVSIIHITLELWGIIVCVCCLTVLVAGRKYDRRRKNYLTALLILGITLLLGDAGAWAYRGDPSTLGFYMVRICNFLNFLSYDLLGFVPIMYIAETVRVNGHDFNLKWCRVQAVICIMAVTLLLVSQFTGLYYHFDASNTYIRSKYYWVSTAFAAAMFIEFSAAAIYYRKCLFKSEYLALLAYFLLPVAVMSFQLFNYGLNLLSFATATAIILIFMSFEFENANRLADQNIQLMQQQLELTRLDKELAERNQQIVLSQIQPHFLYNALATISHLCRTDAALAKRAVDSFAEYLRANLDSLKGSTMISFKQELRHTQTYLWLEEMRFGDDLKLEYDIGVSEFNVPSLILQPLAENAVKHGICKTEDGGTVRIITREVNGGVEICVEDDGAGFDMNVKPNDGRSHIGVENVRARIEAICGGTLKLESSPGKGTKATIFLPTEALKERLCQNEHYNGR